MQDYYIDNATDKIQDSRTKDYFKEVVKSYYSENYRSAVVLLYTITICDLVFKLQSLRDIYNDEKAKAILKSIEDMQKAKANSPEWETKLIELIEQQTNLLEPADIANISQLQKHRHLCAHPVLVQNYELYNPNRETVKAHVRNILEGVLTKPPLFSRSIFEDFIKDLAEIQDVTLTDAQLEKFLSNRYFNKFTLILEKQVVRSLWKLTLKLDNEECEANRDINFKALNILIRRSYAEVVKLISESPDAFSINIDLADHVISLLNSFPKIWDVLPDADKVVLTATIDESPNYTTKAIFRSKDVQSHINMILEKQPDAQTIVIRFIMQLADDEGLQDEKKSLCITYFGKSRDFATADARFAYLIRPIINDLTKKEIKKLLKEINDNRQVYDRNRAPYNNREIMKRIDELYDGDFNYEPYPHFYV